MLQMAYNAIFKRFRRISQFQIRNTQSNHFNSGIHHTATKSQFQIHSQGTSSGLYLPDLSRCPAQAVRNRSDNRRGVSSPYSLIVSSVSAGYIKSRSTKSSGASSHLTSMSSGTGLPVKVLSCIGCITSPEDIAPESHVCRPRNHSGGISFRKMCPAKRDPL